MDVLGLIGFIFVGIILSVFLRRGKKQHDDTARASSPQPIRITARVMICPDGSEEDERRERP